MEDRKLKLVVNNGPIGKKRTVVNQPRVVKLGNFEFIFSDEPDEEEEIVQADIAEQEKWEDKKEDFTKEELDEMEAVRRVIISRLRALDIDVTYGHFGIYTPDNEMRKLLELIFSEEKLKTQISEEKLKTQEELDREWTPRET